MSELKVYGMNDPEVGDEYEMYKVSDVDEVIALLKDKANYNEYAYKHKSEEFADTCRFYEKEIRHSKRKRCLAMARWCRTSARCDEGLGAFKYRDWYWKWFKRWLELAEKFKEAK